MGYSLGGMTALRLAIQHPDRVRRAGPRLGRLRAATATHPEVLAAMDAMSARSSPSP